MYILTAGREEIESASCIYSYKFHLFLKFTLFLFKSVSLVKGGTLETAQVTVRR